MKPRTMLLLPLLFFFVNLHAQTADTQHATDVYAEALRLQNQCKPNEADSCLLLACNLFRQQGDEENLMLAIGKRRALYRDLHAMDRVHAMDLMADSLFSQSRSPRVRLNYYLTQARALRADGDYRQAEHYWLRYFDSLNLLPEGKQRMAALHVYWSGMRDLLVDRKDYAGAVDYARQSVRLLSDNPTTQAMSLGQQASIEAHMGDTLAAQTTLERLEATLPDLTLSEDDAYLLHTLMGLVRDQLGHSAAANREYLLADSAVAAKYPADHMLRLRLRALQGKLAVKEGRFGDAADHFTTYAQGMARVRGEQSDDYAEALWLQAKAEARNGHEADGRSHYMESARLLQHNVRSTLRFVSPIERAAYWEKTAKVQWDMTAFAVNRQADADFLRAAYDAHLFSRSLLLESDRSLYDVLAASGDTASLRVYRQLAAWQAMVRKLGQTDAAKYSAVIAKLQTAISAYDRRLAATSAAYGDYARFLDLSFDDVRQRLAPGEVLVDFADYTDEAGQHRHVAFVLTPTCEAPRLVTLFTSAELDALLQGRPADALYAEETAGEVAALLWSRLAPLVGEGSTVCYVPSGAVHGIALDCLPLPDGTRLDDHYSFRRFTSARQLVLPAPPADAPLTATLIGAPQNTAFPALPQSAKELAAIGRALSKGKFKASLHTGSACSAAALTALSGQSTAILHVATHGFYTARDSFSASRPLRSYDDVMDSCGLVLSDTLFTATDLACLDLHGTRLAVLSACRTAQGQSSPDGLFGLQRALKRAGAGTLLLTLWDVSDVASTEFMQAFYTALLNQPDSPREAFATARRHVRDRYPQPFYWAAFVLQD